MLILDSITLRVAGKLLIENASLSLPQTIKAGFIGANGSGKSSLFRAILGDLPFEAGEARLPKTTHIAAIKQEMSDITLSPLAYLLHSNQEQNRLLEQAKIETDPTRLAYIHERLNALDAYSAESRASHILSALGFEDSMQKQPLSAFSSGWRMRVALAALLFSKPTMLLLDEPTNYLDLEGSLWLIDYLKHYPYNAIIISHDKSLLNQVTNAIIHLDNKKLSLWSGNYDSFLKQRCEKMQLQEKQAQKQAEKKKHLESFILRFKAKASKAKQAQSRVKALAKLNDIELLQQYRAHEFTFPLAHKKLTSTLIKIENGSVGYGDNPCILQNLTLRIESDDRIALLGINGSGKSSFAKLLTQALPLQTGTIAAHPQLKIALFSQSRLEELSPNETAYEHLAPLFPHENETIIRSKLAQMGFDQNKMDTYVKHLSGGEKTRLLLGLVTCQGAHLLILDEPTNHLDIESCEALIKAVNQFEGAILTICHDQYFVEMTMDRLWRIDQKTISDFEGDLEDYKNYVLSNHKKRIKKTASSVEKTTEKTRSKQEQRKFTAQQRLNYADLKKEIQNLEKIMENLQNDLNNIDQELNNKTLYQNDKNQFIELGQKRTKKEKMLKETEELWLTKAQYYEERIQE